MSNPTHKISLRQAIETDRSFIESTLTQAGLTTDGIKKTIDWVYLGWLNDSPAAIGGIEPAGKFGLLRSVVILPDLRGKGYGLRFCELLIREARGLDFLGLYLLTTTSEPFFARLGFEKADRSSVSDRIASTKEFSDICPDTAICMYLAL